MTAITLTQAEARTSLIAIAEKLVTSLVGSEKQQDWAVKIIYQTLDAHSKLIGMMVKGATSEVIQQIGDKIYSRTSAAWWIDNRVASGVDLRALLA